MKSITGSKAKESITKAKFINIAESAEDWKTPVFGITHNSGKNGHFSKYLKDLEGVDANNYYVGMADLIAKKLNIK